MTDAATNYMYTYTTNESPKSPDDWSNEYNIVFHLTTQTPEYHDNAIFLVFCPYKLHLVLFIHDEKYIIQHFADLHAHILRAFPDAQYTFALHYTHSTNIFDGYIFNFNSQHPETITCALEHNVHHLSHTYTEYYIIPALLPIYDKLPSNTPLTNILSPVQSALKQHYAWCHATHINAHMHHLQHTHHPIHDDHTKITIQYRAQSTNITLYYNQKMFAYTSIDHDNPGSIVPQIKDILLRSIPQYAQITDISEHQKIQHMRALKALSENISPILQQLDYTKNLFQQHYAYYAQKPPSSPNNT